MKNLLQLLQIPFFCGKVAASGTSVSKNSPSEQSAGLFAFRLKPFYNQGVYKLPAKLAIGLFAYGPPVFFALGLFVVAHLAIVWSTRAWRFSQTLTTRPILTVRP